MLLSLCCPMLVDEGNAETSLSVTGFAHDKAASSQKMSLVQTYCDKIRFVKQILNRSDCSPILPHTVYFLQALLQRQEGSSDFWVFYSLWWLFLRGARVHRALATEYSHGIIGHYNDGNSKFFDGPSPFRWQGLCKTHRSSLSMVKKQKQNKNMTFHIGSKVLRQGRSNTNESLPFHCRKGSLWKLPPLS
jgi:hypothetical protein